MTPLQKPFRPALHGFAFLAASILLCLLLAACTAGSPSATATASTTLPAAQATDEPMPEPTANPPVTPAPSATAAPPAPSIWLPDSLPLILRDALVIPEGWQKSVEPDQSDLQIRVVPSGDPDPGFSTWIYALVAPFPTVTDAVTAQDLRQFWTSGSFEGLPFQKLLIESTAQSILAAHWGDPSGAVQVANPDRLVEDAWNTPGAWAIVPFEQLEPRWKVIQIDAQSPVQKTFDASGYPLAVRFTLVGDPALRERFLSEVDLPDGNRDPEKLTTVVLTGVTALVRGTAALMEVIGLTYPAQDIGPWLREADILHISNEVPFARNCPQPVDWKDLVFCSQTEYITLLEDVSADVIELTGDHFADWGPDAMLYTLELYQERGWPYYGGGANLEEAQQPVLLEHNGNKIAFIGCNGKEPGYATASADMPGAGHCDFAVMTEKIMQLRSGGYLPIVTFQHLEYYQYVALPELQVDFHQVSAAGAAIVSGSQAHHPHAFEFRDEAFMHYGLGNLFFDQTNQGDEPRTAFIDRHIVYDGRHISTELLTIYLVDYARSRPMNPDEREALLNAVFSASGW